MAFEDRFFDELKKMQKSLNRFFSDFDEEGTINLRDELSEDYRRAMSDFKETENEFIVNIEIPGVNKEDIDLNVNENQVEVKATKKQEKESKKDEDSDSKRSFYSKSYSGFYQSFTLPQEADSEKIQAKYENGVLTLTIPKKPKSGKDKGKYIKINWFFIFLFFLLFFF